MSTTVTAIATREELEYSGVYVAFIGAVVVLIVAMALMSFLEWLQRDDDAAEAEGPAPAFTCPDCGARSWNPNDGQHGYCGRCKAFTGRPAGLDLPIAPPTPRTRPA